VVRRLPLLAGAEAAAGWRAPVESPPDGRAVLGDVPGRPGAFACHGLGLTGLSLSRGVGEALAVRLVHGRWPIGLNLQGWEAARFAAADEPRAG
jgi:glycine/D-amino acid oxidase-like deaminating enzyme